MAERRSHESSVGLANGKGEAVMTSAGRPATDPNGVTGALCMWLEHVSLNDAPDIVRERAKYLLPDDIGCALVGANQTLRRGEHRLR